MSEKKMEFLTSLELEVYLANTLVDEQLDNDQKKKVHDFLSNYLFEDLYACEYIDGANFVLTVENGEDVKLDSIVLCEEFGTQEDDVEEKLIKEARERLADRVIIDRLKKLNFENLINTEECLEDYLDTMSELNEESREEQSCSIGQTEKALGLLKVAIKERCSEMIAAEKRFEEMLCK